MLEFVQKRGLLITIAASVLIIVAFFVNGQDVGLILNGAYTLFAIALVLAVLLPILSAFKNPKVLLVPVIGLTAIAIFFFIGYSMSNNLVLESGTEIISFVEHNQAKLSGGLLNTTFILLGTAIFALFIGPILKLINN